MLLRSSVSVLALAWAGAAAAQTATVPLQLPHATAAVHAATGAAAPVKLEPGAQAQAGSATALLLREAEGWRKRGRKDLAREALQRAAAAAPNDPEVVYRQALYAAQDGDGGTAARELDRLRSLTGAGDRRVREVAAAMESRTTEAAQAPAPASAPTAEAGDRPIGHAAPARPVDPSGAARAAGFVAYNRGDLETAQEKFAEALRLRPSDTDASGGLGLVRLRQQRFADAAALLRHAAAGPGGERWREALQSAEFYGGLASARAELEAGRADRAAAQARALVRTGGKDAAEAELVLGQALMRLGRYAEAVDAYRDLVARDPLRTEARAALAEALARSGQVDEAARMAAALPRTSETQGERARIERARAEQLQARGDTFGAAAALAAAVTADPSNPWSRYQYARFLAGQGQPQQAAQVAAPLFTAEAPDIDTLQAAALYAEFAGRPDQALAIVGRIPESARNAAVRELAERLDVQAAIERARALQRSGQTVQAVSSLREFVAANDLPFAGRSRAAAALLDLGDAYQANALALAAAHAPPPADVRPGDAAGFVEVLGATGQDEAAAALLNALAQHAQTGEDQTAWRRIYAGYAVRKADQQRQAGDFAHAFDTLSGAFAVAPGDADVLAALGRLYQAGGLSDRAAQVYDALLQQKPNDPALLLEAAHAAGGAHDLTRAAALLQRAAELKPTDPELFYELGRIEQARGHEREALRALHRADELLHGAAPVLTGAAAGASGGLGPNPFANMPGPAAASPLGVPAASPWPATAPLAAPAPAYGVPANGNPAATYPAAPMAYPLQGGAAPFPAIQPPGAAPAFGGAPLPYAPAYPQTTAAAAAPAWSQAQGRPPSGGEATAPLGARVHDELAALQQDTAARLEGKFHTRVRSGAAGTSQLTEVSASTTIAGSPFGGGRLGLVAEPVWLNAGTPSGAAAGQIGTNPLLGQAAASYPSLKARSAAGVAVSATYDGSVVHADVGATPLGFQKTNINAGVSVTPKIGPATIRASVEQRPVTDSVLSYAGDVDPLTGTKYGSVVRQQAGLGVSTDFGRAGLYADAYDKRYVGENVAANKAYEVNGGAYLKAIDDGKTQVQLGVNVNFQHFDKNLRYFSLGQGGYFSPQTFVAASLPITVSHKDGDWSFSGNISPGLQSYTEDSSPVFPNDQALQDRLASLTLRNANANASYPSTSRSGFGLAGYARGEYHVQANTFAGGEVTFNTFGPYSEYVFNIYLRQLLSSQ